MLTRSAAVERAITTAYLYSGFEEADRHPGTPLERYGSWSDACGGNIGIVETLAEFAFTFEEVMQNYRDFDYPGTLAYEIIEPLGSWLLEQGEPPSDDAFRTHVHATVSDWLGVDSQAGRTAVTVNDSKVPVTNSSIWFNEATTFSGTAWGTSSTGSLTPVDTRQFDLENWKDSVNIALLANCGVTIDDINMNDTQLREHIGKTPIEFASWYLDQEGTV